MVGPARPVFVLFGSSIVQLSYSFGGWGAILSTFYSRQADILLRGYAGWNSRRALQVVDEVFPKNAPTHPTLAIVYFGGNDSFLPHPDGEGTGPHVPLTEYIENMRVIATHLKSLSDDIRIIFLSCPPCNEEKVLEYSIETGNGLIRTNETSELYSEACIELCREMDLKFVDMFNALQQKDDWKNVCFIEDGLHLSAVGSKIVAEEILSVLKHAEWEPSLHWKALPIEYEVWPLNPAVAANEETMNFSKLTSYEGIKWD